MKIEIDLDHCFLRRVFRVSLVGKQRQKQKIDGPLTWLNELMEQMLLARQDPANTFGVKFRVGWRRHSQLKTSGFEPDIAPVSPSIETTRAPAGGEIRSTLWSTRPKKI